MRQATGAGRFIAAMSIACSIAAGISGCSLHKAPPRSEITAKALPATTTIPPGWTPVSPTGADVSNDWLKTFNDAGLEAVVNEAIANNTDLRKAAASVEVARESAVLVGARLKPEVNLSAGGSATRDHDADETFRSNEIYVQVAWEADIWGRVRAQRAAAVAAYQATALDYAFARQSVAATTAQTWFLAIETRQLVGLAQQSVDIHTRLLDIAKAKYAAGKELVIYDVPKLIGIDYFAATAKGMQDAAKELGNVELIYDGPTSGEASEAVALVDQWTAQGVDVIAVSPNDPAVLGPASA